MKPFPPSPSPRIAYRPRFLTLSVVSCIALCLVLPAVARADDESKDAKKSKPEATKPATEKAVKAKPNDQKKTDKVLVTGSLIPQRVSRTSGPLTTASQVYIIDAEQIRRTGAASVGGVLSRHGMNR